MIEHYGFPGKAMRRTPGSVFGALACVHKMLAPGGTVRIATPDFGALARLYVEGKKPLYPQLAGRLCGEQEYRENLHRCLFDRDFLTLCLETSGFVAIEEWQPEHLRLERDASFDQLNGVRTSLNVLARKPA